MTTPPLAGLTVVDLSTTVAGAQAAQFFADSGADVIGVEQPGGSPVRNDPAWPVLLRNRRSVTFDIETPEGRESFDGLLAGADVLILTMRPKVSAALGLTATELASRHPRLVTAHITGWGTTGPWADYKDYEALVNAKTGVMFSKRGLTLREGPAYVNSPYATWGAAQAAVQGILAALVERETSGLGQVVEADLVRGVGAFDTYNWFYELVLRRFPGAYAPMDAAYDDEGYPQAYLIYALLIAATKDGRWLQFAQTAPRLMQAWLVELGVAAELADPKWAGFPMLPTRELRQEWLDKMLDKVGERTFEEWQETFARNSDVSGETFRTPLESFDHPQVVHEGRVVTVRDPELGNVRGPATLVQSQGRSLVEPTAAPRAGEHTADLASLIASAASSPEGTPSDGLPLEGITILEFGVMFAGPYGATLLTDLGARVIKIESLEGDNIRQLVAFPEAGGAKVLQGKESLAVDITTPEGNAIVRELVKKADVVLQCFRAGAAERAGVDEATLKAINPDLVYLSAPGYGVDGPYAAKPAYAPTVAAAAGFSVIDGGGDVHSPVDNADRLASARTLHSAAATPAVQADGAAALGVGTSLLLGIYAKKLGREIPGMVATMLGSALQTLVSFNVDYEGRPAAPKVDPEFYGLGALYRLYQAADGWVFLAARAPGEWDELVAALAPHLDLGAESRFATAEQRTEHDGELVEVLADVFKQRTASEWETELTGKDVGCVACAEETAEWVMQDDAFYEAGYAVDAVSPIFDEHRRLAPITTFSRSRTKADGGCTIGQHTRSVLSELGYDEPTIEELAGAKVIGLG